MSGSVEIHDTAAHIDRPAARHLPAERQAPVFLLKVEFGVAADFQWPVISVSIFIRRRGLPGADAGCQSAVTRPGFQCPVSFCSSDKYERAVGFAAGGGRNGVLRASAKFRSVADTQLAVPAD